MDNNFYNEENTKHSDLIKDLKELPNIKAPENFEFNLMTRIQNKSFEKFKETRPQFNLVKFFAPSAAVVTLILLIIIFLPRADQNSENPLMAEPSVIENKANQIIGSATNGTINNKRENTQPKTSLNTELSPSRNYDIVVNTNDAVVKEKVKYPIYNRRSVALDDYISGSNAKSSNIRQGNVVRIGEEPAEFDGFFVKQEADKETIEKYRVMLDSVKKAQAKADSLKRIRKIE